MGADQNGMVSGDNKQRSRVPSNKKTKRSKPYRYWRAAAVTAAVVLLLYCGFIAADYLLGTRASEMIVYGDWIYYQDYTNGYTLWRMRTDGSQIQRLSYIEANNITAGRDHVYFVTDYFDGPLYRASIDDGMLQKVSNQRTSSVTGSGQWIYCNQVMPGSAGKSKLSLNRIDADNGNVQTISDDSVSWINVIGDWIYFSNNRDQESIYRIKADGSQKEKLNNEHSLCLVLSGEWIYYSSYGINDDYANQRLCRIRVDGSERQILTEDSPSPSTGAIAVSGEWVYFRNWEKGDYLYRVRTDGSGLQRLNNERSDYINVVGDTIYYISYSFWGDRIHKINIDGTGQETL